MCNSTASMTKMYYNSFSSSLPLRADKKGHSVWHSKIPGCCLSSPCIMLYSAAAYLNISQPAAWCVRLIVVTPTTSNGFERKMLWYKTSSSCLFIEESTSPSVLNMILYLQYRDCHCAERKMLYRVRLYVTQVASVFFHFIFNLNNGLILM